MSAQEQVERRRRSSTRCRGDDGQAVPLIVAVVAVAFVAVLALGRFAVGTVDAARARTAADAAALAGAAHGRADADRAASANGGQVESFAQVGDDVVVVVRVGSARATARATITLVGPGAGASGLVARGGGTPSPPARPPHLRRGP